jgi:hypothetical protein
MIEWLHAPGHAGSVQQGPIEMAVATQAHLIDWSEMYWNCDELREHGDGYKHFFGDPGRTDSRGRSVNHDVVISVRKDAKVIHNESFFVCAEVKSNIKYMPERHGKAVVVDFEGVRVLLIAWHPHPNPFRRPKEVLPKYRRSVRRVQKVQDRLVARYKPNLVLNGGDLQLRTGPTPIHPNRYAKRNRMDSKSHKIDWQMWLGAAFKFESFKKLYPQKVHPKMDHVWTLLTLERK